MRKLRGASVVVAGLGAVGSYAVEGLARAGIGRLRLVDFDVIRRSNINRQLYALESTLGRRKVEVAAARVKDIHPECVVESWPLFIGPENVETVLDGNPDALVDAIDSLSPKIHLLSTAARSNIFIVSSMGAATRTDPFALRVGDLSETRECPLARLLRKRLARQGIRSGIRCVYSIEPARPSAGAPMSEPLALDMRRGRPRTSLGSLPMLTGMFGLLVAHEVVRGLLGRLNS